MSPTSGWKAALLKELIATSPSISMLPLALRLLKQIGSSTLPARKEPMARRVRRAFPATQVVHPAQWDRRELMALPDRRDRRDRKAFKVQQERLDRLGHKAFKVQQERLAQIAQCLARLDRPDHRVILARLDRPDQPDQPVRYRKRQSTVASMREKMLAGWWLVAEEVSPTRLPMACAMPASMRPGATSIQYSPPYLHSLQRPILRRRLSPVIQRHRRQLRATMTPRLRPPHSSPTQSQVRPTPRH